jgi:signal transduction histidine kinase
MWANRSATYHQRMETASHQRFDSAPTQPSGTRPGGWARAILGGLAYLVVLIWATVAQPAGQPGAGSAQLIAVAAAVLLWPLARRVPWAALVLVLLATADAAGAGHSSAIVFIQFMITGVAVGYLTATRSNRQSIPAAVVAALVAALSAPLLKGGGNNLINMVAFALLLMATAWTVGRSVRDRRQHASAMRSQAAHQAVTDERLRIARELHDVVAHSIGVIAIQAGMGRRVIKTQPDEAAKALEVIEVTSRETLGGLRRTLGTLRGTDPQSAPREPAPGLADIDRLVGSSGDAGVTVNLRRLGEHRAVPVDIDASAYRIVQEALTNVIRHAGTGECTVTVDYRADDLYVEITDDGRGSQTAGAGYGIVGMRERVALLNGDFLAGPRPEGGFRVSARLPLPVAAR